MLRHDFYVYALLRPPKCGGPGPLAPFYIGKGRKFRVHTHKRSCQAMKTIKDRICAKVIEQTGALPFVKLHEGLTDAESQTIERSLIERLGRVDLGTGILANMTDGGDGASGYILTERERRARDQRIASIWESDEFRARFSQACSESRRGMPSNNRAKTPPAPKAATPEALRQVKSSNATKMHAALGEGWVAERNRRVAAEQTRAKEPVIRQARCFAKAGLKPYQIAERMNLTVGTAYRHCSSIYDYLDEATEPAAQKAA